MSTKEYFKEEYLVKDDMLEEDIDYIKCGQCKGIFYEPQRCSICGNSLCSDCVKQLNNQCPNKCKNAVFSNNRDMKHILKSTKFKCIKNCGSILKYDEVTEHYKNPCPNKKDIKLSNSIFRIENEDTVSQDELKEVIKYTGTFYIYNIIKYNNKSYCIRYNSSRKNIIIGMVNIIIIYIFTL